MNSAAASTQPQVRPNIANIGGAAPRPAAPPVQTFALDEVITTMVNAGEGVSDLLFVVGRLPQVEMYGKLTGLEIEPLTPMLTGPHVEAIALKIIGDSERLTNDLKNSGSCDTSYYVPGLARFRVNIFKQNNNHAIVMRKLSTKIPTCDSLNLQPIFKEIIKEKTGIVFVTGATGSGKTTTLAAMLNEINQNSEVHIVTLEDPIEFLHPHLKATFSQRQLGNDFSDFNTGLRAALRQAPKVILVGEIRDRETMEIALTAAETGHIVFSTLHTISAAQTVNRIIGMFTSEEEQQIRQRLADTLRYVISQRLAPKAGGGRIMVNEIMGSNLRTREAILLGESDLRDFHEIIESSYQAGWNSFEQCLLRLFREGTITEEIAQVYSVNKSSMRKALDVTKKEMGTGDQGPSGFKLMDHHEEAPAYAPRATGAPGAPA
ncbi:MAG: PilT/PilU family type 4a pilus ATPase, partial [Chthoniobacter sp.]|uniref:type IV pilus twitching motility protein PilT n=1 Tax=Chthoniobacter sp. TaxID=2510640 RepID=UPI0032AE2553